MINSGKVGISLFSREIFVFLNFDTIMEPYFALNFAAFSSSCFLQSFPASLLMKNLSLKIHILIFRNKLCFLQPVSWQYPLKWISHYCKRKHWRFVNSLHKHLSFIMSITFILMNLMIFLCIPINQFFIPKFANDFVPCISQASFRCILIREIHFCE